MAPFRSYLNTHVSFTDIMLWKNHPYGEPCGRLSCCTDFLPAKATVACNCKPGTNNRSVLASNFVKRRRLQTLRRVLLLYEMIYSPTSLDLAWLTLKKFKTTTNPTTIITRIMVLSIEQSAVIKHHCFTLPSTICLAYIIILCLIRYCVLSNWGHTQWPKASVCIKAHM